MKSIQEAIESNQYEELVTLCKSASQEQAKAVIDEMLALLRTTKKATVRNTISIVMRELSFDNAVDTLVELINKPENRNCRGTMLYALETLHCESRVKDLLYLFQEGNYETQYNIYCLVMEKSASMTFSERRECLSVLRKLVESEQDEDVMDTLNECISHMENLLNETAAPACREQKTEQQNMER